jgi:DNA-binding Xre family transcriptional regulator
MVNLSECIIVTPDGTHYSIQPSKAQQILQAISGLTGETLGLRLRELRDERELSQREVARRAAMTHAQLNRIEMGKINQPHRSILGAIVRAICE